MSNWDRDGIIDLLLRAGTLALEIQTRPETQEKADGSVVTKADTAVEDLLRRTLDAPERDRWVIGEEGEDCRAMSRADVDKALAGTCYIVDPIDGTAPFANGLPNWGISIGLAQNGTLVEGAVYLPATGELYISSADQIYLATVIDAAVYRIEVLEPCPAAFHRNGMIALSQLIAKNGNVHLPNPVQAIGSAVVPLAYLLQGRYMAYYGTLKLWDLAGAWPLLQKAGFEGILLDGQPLNAAITSDLYVMDTDHQDRWKLRQSCLFGPAGMAAHVLPHMTVRD